MRPLVLSCTALAALLSTLPALADDEALARTLFDEGIKALDAGEYEKACPKLEESLRLKANANVQFYLAECFEHQGKTASAWTNFLGASAKSKEAGKPDKAAEAKARADALQGKLVWVTIVVESPTEGLEVTRAGAGVPKAQWGVSLPVDPGEIVVTASAPKKQSFRTKIDATTEGAKLTVTVRELDDAPAPKADPPATPKPTPTPAPLPREVPAKTGGGGSSALAWTFGLGGLAVAGGGIALELFANSTRSRIENGSLATGADIEKAESDIKLYRPLGWTMIGVGAGGVIAGVIIGATSRSSGTVTVGPAPYSTLGLSVTWRTP